jgi:hypothetical protein
VVPSGFGRCRRYDSGMQTRYLILASLAVGLVILGATALWFTTL